MADVMIQGAAHEAVDALPIGTVLLHDQFAITGHLGAGGFGITYRAEDTVLGRTIVIKECFPPELCGRSGRSVRARSQAHVKPMRSIVGMFMREARSLAKLRHPNIVGVHRAFEENDTAYMVLDLIEGRDLFDIVEESGLRLSPARVRDILLQLLDAVEEVHKLGLLHRDISPDNILIEQSGTPVLIDFGAARADSSRHSRTTSSFLVVKDGYSPQEFYVAGSEQTPSSDLYALAATFYFLLTGAAPPNSQARVMDIASGRPDPCVPLAGRVPGYDDAFLCAIDTALRIHPADRLQSAAKWRSLIENSADALDSNRQSKPRSMGRAYPLELELTLSQLVEETNDEVWKSKNTDEPPAPVEAPQPVSAQPAWVEEFNRESASRSPGSDAAFATRQEFDDFDMDGVEIWDDTHGGVASRPRTQSETDWVERALVKRDHQRSSQIAASTLEAPVIPDMRRAVSGPISEPPDWDQNAMAAAYGTQPRIRPFGVLVGLIVSLCLVAGLNALDGAQTSTPSKPIASSFEMRGSIVR